MISGTLKCFTIDANCFSVIVHIDLFNDRLCWHWVWWLQIPAMVWSHRMATGRACTPAVTCLCTICLLSVRWLLPKRLLDLSCPENGAFAQPTKLSRAQRAVGSSTRDQPVSNCSSGGGSRRWYTRCRLCRRLPRRKMLCYELGILFAVDWWFAHVSVIADLRISMYLPLDENIREHKVNMSAFRLNRYLNCNFVCCPDIVRILLHVFCRIRIV